MYNLVDIGFVLLLNQLAQSITAVSPISQITKETLIETVVAKPVYTLF